MLGAVAYQGALASPAPSDLPNESTSQTLPVTPLQSPEGIAVETLPMSPLPPVNIDNNVDADEAVETAIVSGSVAYRERIAISSGAIIEIKLIDVSRSAAPAIT